MSEDKKIRVLVVDDHSMMREGLSEIITVQPNMVVVGEAENGRQALELFQRHRPDVTLMDLRMPVMGGVEATAAIIKEHPKARIIVLTTYDGDENIYRALQAGAKSYLVKRMRRREVLEAIKEVHAGYRYIPSEVAARMAERPNCAASGQPDLVVTDISWAPASPAVGDAVTFSATIKNQGIGATPDGIIHGVRFRVDGTTVSCSDNSTATLVAGASRVVTANNCGVTWTATSGTHTVEALVDDINRITNESNETNNALTKSLTPGSGAVTIVYETANPPAAKSSDTHTLNSDTGASGGSFTKLAANAVNDYVSYAIPNVEARAYTVTVRIKRRVSRGSCRMAIANTVGGTYTNIGNPFDEYGASEVFADVVVGTINPSSAGTKYLKFTVTGKNGSSSGYELTFDKITLTPQ